MKQKIIAIKTIKAKDVNYCCRELIKSLNQQITKIQVSLARVTSLFLSNKNNGKFKKSQYLTEFTKIEEYINSCLKTLDSFKLEIENLYIESTSSHKRTRTAIYNKLRIFFNIYHHLVRELNYLHDDLEVENAYQESFAYSDKQPKLQGYVDLQEETNDTILLIQGKLALFKNKLHL